MLTVSIKESAKKMCVPLTVNRLLSVMRLDRSVFTRFWPCLVKDKEINNGRKVGVKLDPENREFLRELKKHIKACYGIFVPYSMLVCVLLKIYNLDSRINMTRLVTRFRESHKSQPACSTSHQF